MRDWNLTETLGSEGASSRGGQGLEVLSFREVVSVQRGECQGVGGREGRPDPEGMREPWRVASRGDGG